MGRAVCKMQFAHVVLGAFGDGLGSFSMVWGSIWVVFCVFLRISACLTCVFQGDFALKKKGETCKKSPNCNKFSEKMENRSYLESHV